MRRLATIAPWAICIFALAHIEVDVHTAPAGGDAPEIAVTVTRAEAQPRGQQRRPAVTRCVRYNQTMRDSDMDLSLDNRCNLDLSCSMSWEPTCHGDDGAYGKRREGQVFELDTGRQFTAVASASRCGEDGWEVSDVRWTCEAADSGAAAE